MIRPTITSFTESLNDIIEKSDTIWLVDHMPYVSEIRISIQGKNTYFKNTIIDLFDCAKFEYQDKTFISDHYLIFEDFKKFKIDVDANIFVKNAELFFNGSTYKLENKVLNHFTFISNKSRYHRILCSTVIANLFNNNIAYSYNSTMKDSVISTELLLNTEYTIDPARTLPDSWIPSGTTDKVFDNAWGGVVNYGFNNRIAFDSLYDKLYKNSATSIITEPCFFENGNMLTEKTLMSIYAMHFLIWPGAWKMAETAEKLGIDVFNDVIDHSYQYIKHPGKRVVEAFLRNKQFLDNMELQQKTREKCLGRLYNNLNLIRNIPKIKTNLQSLNFSAE